MKRMKALVAMLLATTMIAGAVVPAQAAVISRDKRSTATYVTTDNLDKYAEFPVWVWWHGYCYYYDSPRHYLTNCTTPDGYTVDEYGRWTENGVAVHNGFGSVNVGSSEYLGKSNDEIWNLMYGKLVDTFENSLALSSSYTYAYSDYAFQYNGKPAGAETTILNIDKSDDELYIMAWIGPNWSDEAESMLSSAMMASYANAPDVKEKIIKTLVGDNVGTELFNAIKTHADKKSTGWQEVLGPDGNPIKGNKRSTMDSNGNVTWYFEEDQSGVQTKMEKVDNIGDGIYASTMDLSAWQNRTTDYGKKFSLEANGEGFILRIYK